MMARTLPMVVSPGSSGEPEVTIVLAAGAAGKTPLSESGALSKTAG
jgi:hypothetical protein